MKPIKEIRQLFENARSLLLDSKGLPLPHTDIAEEFKIEINNPYFQNVIDKFNADTWENYKLHLQTAYIESEEYNLKQELVRGLERLLSYLRWQLALEKSQCQAKGSVSPSKTHSLEEKIEHTLEFIENSGEIVASSTETLEILRNNADFIQKEEPDILSFNANTDTIAFLPIVNDFIRSGFFFHHAYKAYQTPKDPQRSIKIATGLGFGSVSVGIGVTGILFYAGVGLLATAAAILIAPIVLSGAVVAISLGVIKYNDYLGKKLKEELSKEIKYQKEKYIAAYLYSSQEDKYSVSPYQPIINIQEKIDEMRAEKNHSARVLSDLETKRDQLIAQAPELQRNIEMSWQLHLPTIPKVKKIESEIKKNQQNMKLDIVTCIGFAFLLAALFIPVVGLVAFGIGSLLLLVSSTKRLQQQNDTPYLSQPPHRSRLFHPQSKKSLIINASIASSPR